MPETDATTAILDAAEALFARHGFAATTIKAIGADAGVNPALLYYYFPDKEKLYHAVLERRIGTLGREVSQAIAAPLPPLEALTLLLRGYAARMQEFPTLPRLLVRELADHQAAHALPFIREMAAGLFRRICEIIEAGQRQGAIRRELDPRFTAIALVAQMAWFFVAQPAVARMLGHEGTIPGRVVDRYVDNTVQLSLAALAAPPRAARTRSRARGRS